MACTSPTSAGLAERPRRGPEAGHKLDLLRAHCDAVGRDHGQIEKTAMLTLDPRDDADDRLLSVPVGQP